MKNKYVYKYIYKRLLLALLVVLNISYLYAEDNNCHLDKMTIQMSNFPGCNRSGVSNGAWTAYMNGQLDLTALVEDANHNTISLNSTKVGNPIGHSLTFNLCINDLTYLNKRITIVLGFKSGNTYWIEQYSIFSNVPGEDVTFPNNGADGTYFLNRLQTNNIFNTDDRYGSSHCVPDGDDRAGHPNFTNLSVIKIRNFLETRYGQFFIFSDGADGGNNNAYYGTIIVSRQTLYSPHVKVEDEVEGTVNVCDDQFEIPVDPNKPITYSVPTPYVLRAVDENGLSGSRCEWYKKDVATGNWLVLRRPQSGTPFKYNWTIGNSNSSRLYTSNTLNFDILSSTSTLLFVPATSTTNTGTDGEYMVRFTNSYGCISTKIFKLKTKITPKIEQYIPNATDFLCKGQVKTYNLPESWGEFEWEKKDANGIWQCFSNNHQVTLNNVGEYRVHVYTTDACEKIHYFTLIESTVPAVQFNTTDVPMCMATTSTLNLNSFLSTQTYSSLVWSTPNQQSTINELGSYTVVATDAQGCVSNASVNVIDGCPKPYDGEDGWSMVTVLKNKNNNGQNEIELPGNQLTISDPRNGNYGISDKRQYMAIVRLLYARNSHTDLPVTTTTDGWAYTVNYTLTINGVPLQQQQHITISNTLNTKQFESVQNFPIAILGTGVTINNISVTPTNITPSATNEIILELELKEVWVSDMSTSDPNIVQDLTQTTISGNKARFTWTPSVKAMEYELQFAFVDELSTIDRSNTEKILSDKGWSTELSDNSYEMDLTFPKGKLYYRIRPIGRHGEVDEQGKYSFRKYGAWSAVHMLDITPFEADKNWSKVITYAEDGKKKEVINYMDNINRSHQVITNLNTEKISLAAETYYDFEGRGVLNVLPVPLTTNSLNYQTNLAKNSIGNPLSNQDFDVGNQPQLSNSVGAAQYYSPNNAFADPSLNGGKYFANIEKIPNANGYVTTQVQYMRDNTGRVAEQSGVGELFRIENGQPDNLHTTKNYYITASETELRRLFGTNVGFAKYYTKQMTVDPNGQVSLTYTDQSGKTIATALAGISPANVKPLDITPKTSIPYSLDSRNETNVQSGISSLVASIPNVQRNTDHYFKYDLNNVATSSTSPAYCATCIYDFSISITDPDNLPIDLRDIQHLNNGTLVTIPLIPTTPPIDNLSYDPTTKKITGIIGPGKNCPLLLEQVLDELTFTATFSKLGPYTINKQLTLNSGAIDEFIHNTENFPGLETYLQNLINTYHTDPSACDYSCEATTKRYLKEDWLRNHPEINPLDPAQMAQVMIQVDALYTAHADTYCPDAYTQVKNEAENLADKTCSTYSKQIIQQISPPDGIFFNNTSVPRNQSTLSYIQDNYLTDPDIAQFFQPNPPPALPITADYVNNIWSDALADKLMKIHREYCHHQNCETNKATNAFDITMNAVQSWSEAISRGYINATSDGPGSLLLDPVAKYTLCLAKIDHYTTFRFSDGNTYPVSLWKLIDPTTIIYDRNDPARQQIFNASTMFYDGVSASDLDKARWRRFYSLYSAIKMQALADEEEANGCLYLDLVNPDDQHVIYKYPGVKDPVNDIYVPAQSGNFIEEACTICLSTSQYYVNQIKIKCPGYFQQTGAPIEQAVKDFFYNNCLKDCGYSNMYGYIPNNQVDDVLAEFNTHFPACDALHDVLYTGLELHELDPPKEVTSCKLSACMEDLIVWLNTNGFADGLYPTNTATPSLMSCFNDQGIRFISISNGKINLLSDTSSCPNPICNTVLYWVDDNGQVMNTITSIGGNEITKHTTQAINDPTFANTCSVLPTSGTACNSYNFTTPNWNGRGTCGTQLPNRMKVTCNSGGLTFTANTPAIRTNTYTLTQRLQLVPTTDHSLKLNLDAAWVTTLANGNASYGINSLFNNIYRAITFRLVQVDQVAGIPLISQLGQAITFSRTSNNNKFSINNTGVANAFPGLIQLSNIDFSKDILLEITITNSGSISNNRPLTLHHVKIMQEYEQSVYSSGAIQSSTPPPSHAGLNTGAAPRPQFMNYLFPVTTADGIQQGWLYSINLSLDGANCPPNLISNCVTQHVLVAETDELFEPCSPTNPGGFSCPDNHTCQDLLEAQNQALIELLYNKERDRVVEEFLNHHYNNCFNITEHLNYTTAYDEYQYTLYYYDQALNLIQTIPPAAVNPLNATAFDANGNYYFPPDTRHREPHHTQTMLTKYQYNSRNQVVWQRTPDAGETKFWYNKKGQLILSQNAKQANSDPLHQRYSFTQYDHLGRIVTVGELDMGSTPLTNNQLTEALADPLFPYGISSAYAQHTSQITATTYDKPYPFANGIIQQNLQNRVSATFYFEDYNKWQQHDGNGTLYSYDEVGNVKLLTQNQHNTDKKQVRYDYDLISGKVNKVIFQPDNTAERFTHRYEYDADNRITDVYTSREGLIEYHDAKYYYYPHGPLARVELATDKVQGVDYYYSLQGWLKGINKADAVTTSHIPTGTDDGANNLDKYTPTDAVGTELGYFKGDYTAIKPTSFTPMGNAQWNGAGSVTSFYSNPNMQGLFNGNIAFQATGLKGSATQLTHNLGFSQYRYDQLNRIADAQGYTMDNPGQATTYSTAYTYDANGNIETLKRTAWNATTASYQQMDDLNYKYDKIGVNVNGQIEQKLRNNKLWHVNDPVAATMFADDIDDEGIFSSNADGTHGTGNNYEYDEIGQLVKDEAENIEKIDWTVYGKIKSITFKPDAHKADLQFEYDAAGNRVKKTAVNTTTGISTTTRYWRDAQGNALYTYTTTTDATNPANNTEEKEYNIYGSSRLGTYSAVQPEGVSPLAGTYSRYLGQRQYELTNHLGNVLATVADYKTAETGGQAYTALVSTAQDYDPFGMLLPGRNYSNPLLTTSKYRFGFNGQERETEIGSSTTSAEFWIYDGRLGRRKERDPVVKHWISPYATFGDNPILFKDPKGDDWYKNDKDEIRWDNKRDKMGATMDYNKQKWTNIGATLKIETNSFIDAKNDISIKGAEGDKLTTTLSITGNYDSKGNFTGFTSSLDKAIGKTFGYFKGAPATGTESDIKKDANGVDWGGSFDIHTEVNKKEGVGLKFMYGNIVDVNQKVNYKIDKQGMFSMAIGHGTFPSVTTRVVNTNQVLYRFLEHSFVLSHGIGTFSETQKGIGLMRQMESYEANKKYQETNKWFVKFLGYTTDRWALGTYPYLPK